MTYLSQRMREIREEEQRRKQPKWFAGIDWAFPKAMVMVDRHLIEMRERAINQHAQTLRERYPMNYGGRGA
jgi:hypothetical protein